MAELVDQMQMMTHKMQVRGVERVLKQPIDKIIEIIKTVYEQYRDMADIKKAFRLRAEYNKKESDIVQLLNTGEIDKNADAAIKAHSGKDYTITADIEKPVRNLFWRMIKN